MIISSIMADWRILFDVLGTAFHNAPVKGLLVSPLQSPQALSFINHSSKCAAGRSKKPRMSQFWREYCWNCTLQSLSGHSLAAVNESWKGEKKRGRKKRNLASSSCFFQWIKMPSFHKQDDLAAPLDSDSGTGTLLLQLTHRQHCRPALLRVTLEI